MTRLVADASVLAKLHFLEEDSLICRSILSRTNDLVAPEFVWAEFAGVIWKRVAKGQISLDEADEILSTAMRMPLRTVATGVLVQDALRIAIQTGCSVYDSLYLAAAVREQCAVLTADQRLVNRLRNTPWTPHVRWVGDNEKA